MNPAIETNATRLREAIDGLPGVAAVRAAAGSTPASLVGGAVRDLLLGAPVGDLDVVVEGDAVELARALGGELSIHERFGTATVHTEGRTLDLAGARAESYEHPGALPAVRPGSLADDLARRDFTINALAVALTGEAGLIDPHGGRGDLETKTIRVLHGRSFDDDPTRALRAARYAARLGFTPDKDTERLLRKADLGTVSAERVEAELRKLAAEPDPERGLRLAAEWGLVDLDPQALELIVAGARLAASTPWSSLASQADVAMAVLAGAADRAAPLAATEPASPSEGVAAARGRDGTELVVARALGAEWLDDYIRRWRGIRLEVSGADLLAAGVPEGPAVGRGLAAALAAKLDGEVNGHAAELGLAVDAARLGEES